MIGWKQKPNLYIQYSENPIYFVIWACHQILYVANIEQIFIKHMNNLFLCESHNLHMLSYRKQAFVFQEKYFGTQYFGKELMSAI